MREIRIHVAGEFRVLYIAKCDEAVFVPHAYQKKSQKTSKRGVDIAKTRFRELERDTKS